jgi:hypothetical protein
MSPPRRHQVRRGVPPPIHRTRQAEAMPRPERHDVLITATVFFLLAAHPEPGGKAKHHHGRRLPRSLSRSSIGEPPSLPSALFPLRSLLMPIPSFPRTSLSTSPGTRRRRPRAALWSRGAEEAMASARGTTPSSTPYHGVRELTATPRHCPHLESRPRRRQPLRLRTLLVVLGEPSCLPLPTPFDQFVILVCSHPALFNTEYHHGHPLVPNYRFEMCVPSTARVITR